MQTVFSIPFRLFYQVIDKRFSEFILAYTNSVLVKSSRSGGIHFFVRTQSGLELTMHRTGQIFRYYSMIITIRPAYMPTIFVFPWKISQPEMHCFPYFLVKIFIRIR